MVFVCPPKEESEGKTKLLNDLKNIFDEVEKKLTVSAKPICVPCCIPICDLPRVPCPWQNDGNNVSKEQTKPASVPNPPEVMVCYKVCQRSSRPEETSTSDKEVHRVRQSKSRELRASILYTGCDCEKRDGLQDDCQRTGCHGSPECLTNPPTCGPSEFCNAKHLGRKLLSSRKDKNGNGKENGSGSSFKAKYKCFPAVVNDPVSCCPCPQK
ncbi:uncharacterized protein [Leptinotarsa decemlineata]|uniref:uncharacterized protein n=1 Tax=Leptinotarsa decemlineata TaxID=7539 RepID=UPI000C251E6B|nr:uncharacterized protein LOC111513861 [Leptinotarsa decemlineata]